MDEWWECDALDVFIEKLLRVDIKKKIAGSWRLGRVDLSERTRAALTSGETALWEVIRAAEPHRTSELWSWGIAGGSLERVPFGAARGHHGESNPVQLWSTGYLAVRSPMP